MLRRTRNKVNIYIYIYICIKTLIFFIFLTFVFPFIGFESLTDIDQIRNFCLFVCLFALNEVGHIK